MYLAKIAAIKQQHATMCEDQRHSDPLGSRKESTDSFQATRAGWRAVLPSVKPRAAMLSPCQESCNV